MMVFYSRCLSLSVGLVLLPAVAMTQIRTVTENRSTSNDTVFVATPTARFGVGTSTPTAKLHVEGNAHFGVGPKKSTFTSTADLVMSPGASVTLSGPGGVIQSGSSVNASAFFGDGSGLTGIATPANTVTTDTNQTITGVKTFTSSPTFTDDEFSVGGSTLMCRDGRVGVGTTLPATRFDVNGSAQFGSGLTKSTFTSSPGNATFALELSSGAKLAGGGALELTSGGYIRFSDGTSQASAAAGGGASGWTDDGTVVRLTSPGDNVVIASTLTVQGNAFSVGGATVAVALGRVGVGTTAPSTRLHVSGGDVQVGDTDTTASTLSASGFLAFARRTTSPSSPSRGTLFFDANGDGALRLSLDGATFVPISTGTAGSASDPTKVLKAGDTMTGGLTLSGSTLTVGGNAFSVGGSTLVVSGGRVGILTTAPTEALHVASRTRVSSLTADGEVVASTFNAVGSAYQVNGVNVIDSGRNVTASTLTVQGNAFSVGGTTVVVANGRLGIGTVSPSEQLEVTLNARVLGSLTSNSLSVVSSTFVVNNGKVGIGKSNPAQPLDVEGNVHITGSVRIPDSGIEISAANDVTGGLGLRNVQSVSWGSNNDGASCDTSISKNVPGVLEVNDCTLGNIRDMRLRALNPTTGNLGVGTTNPATLLDVQGNAQFGSGATKSTFTATPGGATFALQLSSGAKLAGGGALELTTGGYIRFADGSSQASAVGGGWTDDGTVIRLTDSGDNVVIQSTLTVNGNAFSVGGSTFVVVGSSVGIGTTNPAARLDVNASAQFGLGSAKSTFTATPGGATFALTLSSGASLAGGGPLVLTSGGYIKFGDGTSQATASGGGAFTVAFASASDIPQASGTNAIANRVCLPGSTSQMTIVGDPAPVLVSADGVLSNSGADNSMVIGFLIDGARPEGLTGNQGAAKVVSTAIDRPHLFSFSRLTGTLSAGSHFFCLTVGTGGGTWTYYNNTESRPSFNIVEVQQ